MAETGYTPITPADYAESGLTKPKLFATPPQVKNFFVVLVVIAAGLLAYYHFFPKPEPPVAVEAPPPKHLAPEGTFYIVSYLSVRTPRGITGFVPGQQVTFVSADEKKGKLVVTDGKDKVEVGPLEITNDIDIAALAQKQDQASQANLQVALDAAWKADEKSHRQVDIEMAKDVSRLRGNVIGTSSVLQKHSEPASYADRYGASPYYYLHRVSYLQSIGGG